jgi:hypothetical protein
MESEIARQIRKNVRRYLNGEIRLHEFEDFFVPILWDIEEGQSEADLAGKVHILTSEYSRGDRSLLSLHEELENAIHPFAPRFGATIHAKLPNNQIPIATSKPQERTFTFGDTQDRPEVPDWTPIPPALERLVLQPIPA